MAALNPMTSPALAILRMSTLPAIEQSDSFTRPLHKTKIPRDGWPSANSTEPLGKTAMHLIDSIARSGLSGRSQKPFFAFVLQVRQLSTRANPCVASIATPVKQSATAVRRTQ